MRHDFIKAGMLATLLVLFGGTESAAQTPADRADPSVVREELESDRAPREPARDKVSVRAPHPGVASAPLEPFAVGAVRVEGAIELPRSTFAAAIEPFLGRVLGPDELRELAGAVARAARKAGFGLASAWIPAQSVVNGVLEVRVEEGRIDAVEASGPAARPVERALARAANGRPLRTAELERLLLVAGDMPGITVDRPRLEQRDGRNILLVPTRWERISGYAALDNSGTRAIGPVRLRVDLDINGVLAADDRLSVSGVLTPLQPREFQMIHAAYSRRVGSGGTEASVSGYYAQTRPGSVFARDLEGRSLAAAVKLAHPLIRSRAASLWGSAEAGLRESRLDRASAPVRDERVASVSAAVNGFATIKRGWVRGRLTVVQGLDVLGATRKGDPLASRRDGSGSFSKVQLAAQLSRKLGKGFSTLTSFEVQYAARPLLASEEMGLGGRSFLRGYDSREVAGDNGAAASAELRWDLPRLPGPIKRGQLYGYADAGHVSNLRQGSGGGTLASVGGGMRTWLRDGLEAEVGVGVPLSDSPSMAKPNPQISLRLGVAF